MSVCLIAGNEAARIRRALASVAGWTAEIIVVLNHDVNDGTDTIAESYGAKVFREPWQGHIGQKNSAAQKAVGEWILGLDADEVVSPELRAEIQQLLAAPNRAALAAAYNFPRCTFYCGRWIRHGDWYPDRQTRLWRRGAAAWGGTNPHDKLIVNGGIRRLRGELQHFTNESINKHILKIIPFSDEFVNQKRGHTPGWLELLTRPAWRFFRAYILRRGFLDGWQGYYIAWLNAFSAATRYCKLREANLPTPEEVLLADGGGAPAAGGRSEQNVFAPPHSGGSPADVGNQPPGKHTMPKPVSLYVIAYNEAHNLRAVLPTVGWADEVVVVDSFSTDDTAAVCAEFGARHVNVKFEGFGKLRNDALALLQHDWVVSIDSDERSTPEFAAEVRRTLEAPPHAAYFVPRRNTFLGHPMRFSGMYPDYRQPQVFDRRQFKYRADAVHESFLCEGSVGYFKNFVWQHPWPTLDVIFSKGNRYSTLMAQYRFDKGKRAGIVQLLFNPPAAFVKKFFIEQGFRDGMHGFLISAQHAYYTFQKYAKLWELGQKAKRP